MEHITNQLTAKLYTSRAFRFYFGDMKLAAADVYKRQKQSRSYIGTHTYAETIKPPPILNMIISLFSLISSPTFINTFLSP